MIEKKFISAQELLEDSIRLGLKIMQSGFQPNFIVGIWRGGTPVGIAVQELLDHFGIKTDHIAIRTSSYESIGRQFKEIRVHGLNYVVKNANTDDRLLVVDDVFDTGLSIQAVINTLRQRPRRNTPRDLRVATVYFKPANNKTNFKPDFYIHETDKWLVFPHELVGLSDQEINRGKPDIASLIIGAKK